MRRYCALAFSSLFIVSAGYAQVQETSIKDEINQPCTINDSLTQRIQSHMFDGIELTESQRQRMRDLTDQFRFRHSTTDIGDVKLMQQLTLSPDFDEIAVRRQAQKMADQQVNSQVELAHIRNQIYGLLTVSQKKQVQQNYENRIDNVCGSNELQ
ncbi:Spy/CpxP family protein refolding chaperone [Rosenbergiella australiborealis]|uniref:Cell-envelope stress modulator CpxP n=1 Tax=Rosenbergiella australiborealis TaxID=1544696 RepID=A0ABS5T7I9_9GAMM|nr:Spy/CpxP family protein refolding chaperone [Rosenbergiella australiborealis]MBT0727397.1 cell-envelope stress modulator CpxP [Rosenbergiella australiborealis]